MVGSHMEDDTMQDRDRDPNTPTLGRKDKSLDVISSFEGRIAKLEGDVDLLEQRIEEALGDL